jgi:hypothetical protein
VIKSKHVYNFFLLIYRIEYPEFSDAISPGVRHISFEFFDISPEKWLRSQLRVNIKGELFCNNGFVTEIEFFNALQELIRFKNTIFIQRSVPFALLHP